VALPDDVTRISPRISSPPADRPVQRSRPSRIRSWIRTAVLVVMLGFAVTVVVGNRAEVAAALDQLSVGYALAALPGAVAAMVAALFVWRTLMKAFGARLAVRDAARVFFLSQLGKYVPGSVWSMLAQIELSRDLRVPRRTTVSVAVLALAVSVTVGIATGAAVLLMAAPQATRRYWWALLVLPVLLVLLHPRVIAWLLNTVLRLLRRSSLDLPPSWSGLLAAAGFQLLVWTALGLHIWPILVGMGAEPGRALGVAIGGYALAYSVGQLAVGLPAGAGVREGLLILAFAPMLPGGQPAALVVALLSRMALLAVDLAMAGSQYLLYRRRAARHQ
jgi:glycosyltransferase 2 family protein